MEYLTSAQIRDGLGDRSSLIAFLSNHLSYRTNPVFFEATDLDVPSSLARKVNSWWLLCNYAGNLPFQIHLVQCSELTFNYCAAIMKAFQKRHPGYYLFIFTKNYAYLVFMAIEWSLERLSTPGEAVWPLLPKPYPRFIIIERCNPTDIDISILVQIKLNSSPLDTSYIHSRIIQALKLVQRKIPVWFLPYWYSQRGLLESRKAFKNMGDLLELAHSCVLICLDVGSLEDEEAFFNTDRACEYLSEVVHINEHYGLISDEEEQRLVTAMSMIEDARVYSLDDGDSYNSRMALQHALGLIDEVEKFLKRR